MEDWFANDLWFYSVGVANLKKLQSLTSMTIDGKSVPTTGVFVEKLDDFIVSGIGSLGIQG